MYQIMLLNSLYFFAFLFHSKGSGKQGHTLCRILLLHQHLSLCPSNVMEIIRLLQRRGEFGHPHFL